MIEIVVAPEGSREDLWQLFLEYTDELSVFDGETRPHYKHHYPYFEQFWDDSNRTPFVLIYDHEPIGFCLMEDTGTSYKINDFYIRPLHRRRGFGRLAVERVKDHCRAAGRHSVISANIYVNNTCAVEFWQSAGFRDTGRRLRIKHLRLIEMEAELAE